MDAPRIAVIGCGGRLGAPMLAVFTAAGYETIGADIDAEAVEALNDGLPPPRVNEPGLAELLAENHELRVHQAATTDVAEACSAADVAFVVVPTPSGPDDRFDASMVCEAVRSVCVGFRRRTRESVPVIVLTSTVMPGCCGTEVTGVIEAAGFKVGETCGLCASPEFIALGSVLHDLRNPDAVFLGSDHDWSADVLGSIYARVAPDAPQLRLSLIDAEVAKLATNVYLSVKIGFANEIARLCEATPGADAGAVCAALGADSRIGGRYMQSGGPSGGVCLPRDVKAWSAATRHSGLDPSPFAFAARRSNDEVLSWVVETVTERKDRSDDEVVAVLGLAYKPQTPIAEQALGWDVAEYLGRVERFVAVHDPLVHEIPAGCHVLSGLIDVLEAATIVVVATAHDSYLGLRPMGGQTIIDVWSVCEEGNGKVIRPGIGPPH